MGNVLDGYLLDLVILVSADHRQTENILHLIAKYKDTGCTKWRFQFDMFPQGTLLKILNIMENPRIPFLI